MLSFTTIPCETARDSPVVKSLESWSLVAISISWRLPCGREVTHWQPQPPEIFQRSALPELAPQSRRLQHELRASRGDHNDELSMLDVPDLVLLPLFSLTSLPNVDQRPYPSASLA